MPLASPRAALPGHIAELPAPHDAVDRPGARWTIHAAPGIAVTATAERSVVGGGGCFGSYGVIARVDDEWRDGFRAVRFNYHAARRGAVPAWSPGSTLGVIDAFRAADRARLEAVVRPELDRAIREVVEAAAPDYRRAREHDRAWAVAWRAADAALLRGAGSLDLDALTSVLTPDGDPRLYVRTRVQVGGRSAFAMWFWIRDRGGEMTVEHRSAEPAKHMRIREYGGPFDLPLSRVGDVLGILDADGDGWAEILVTAHGYEGQSITAYEYSPRALEPTGASFHWGC